MIGLRLMDQSLYQRTLVVRHRGRPAGPIAHGHTVARSPCSSQSNDARIRMATCSKIKVSVLMSNSIEPSDYRQRTHGCRWKKELGKNEESSSTHSSVTTSTFGHTLKLPQQSLDALSPSGLSASINGPTLSAASVFCFRIQTSRHIVPFVFSCLTMPETASSAFALPLLQRPQHGQIATDPHTRTIANS
jgi:hypothetical protein